MKNPNGYGSIVKLSGKRRKPFAIRITCGWSQKYDEQGLPIGNVVQKYKYLNFYETRKEAMMNLALYNQGKENIELYQKTDKKKYLCPTFLEMWNMLVNNKKSIWSINTYRNYMNMITFASPLYEMRLDEITHNDCQKTMNEFMALGKTKGTCKLFKSTMTTVFNEAIKNNYITNNPASIVEYKATKQDIQKDVYSIEEIKNIAVSKDFADKLLLVMLYTGMRISEMLNLKKEDIHLEERYLKGGVKTSAGINRTIPIHECLVPIFEERKDSPYFCGDKRLSYTTVYHWYIDKPYTLHETRHTFISMCDEYNVNEIVTKKIVGHSTRDITETIYTHKTLKQLIKEINKIPYPADLK